MCLAIPGKILSIDSEDELMRAGRISFGGTEKLINLAMVPEARVGDYVIVHAGVALNLIDEDEARQIFDELAQLDGIE